MKKLLFVFLLFQNCLFAQSLENKIQSALTQQLSELKLDAEDIAHWKITGKTSSKTTKITTVYIQQYYKNIPIFNAISSIWIKNNEVLSVQNRFVAHCAQLSNSAIPAISASEGLQRVFTHLKLELQPQLLKAESKNNFIFANALKGDPIKVQLTYVVTPSGKLHLAWDMYIDIPKENHMWSIQLDARSGEVLAQNDFMLSCNFEKTTTVSIHKKIDFWTSVFQPKNFQTPTNAGTYRVIPFTTESPNHGPFQLITNPSSPEASPYGWHDTNGIPGAEFTITRGNNVHAFEDSNDLDDPFSGLSPDGGSGLLFDFPYLGITTPAVAYQEAATTNLFYMNNMLHDIFYHYGFDEENGNFQETNYSNFGEGNDHVLAQSQDGGGINNANFGTPPDGSNGRMQMYLWNRKGGSELITINSPSSLAGNYIAFDNILAEGHIALPQTPNSLTSELVLVNDGTSNPTFACEALSNAAAINGKIALVQRGICPVTDKILNCQNAGASGVIIYSNVPGNFVIAGNGDPSITIPAITIKKDIGDIWASVLQNEPIYITLSESPTDFINVDGDFDNIVIAHEYGHGISNRLTGGPANANCLFNQEQMGEGWSDWFGLMLQIRPSDTGTERRGIGTFVINDPTDGDGIRTYPYCTDMSVNPFTFSSTNTLARPHGVGSVWATMLWDLTWAYIQKYGFDPNLFSGTGGNNKVLQLVVDALKLQPCSPSFVDGRDAILAADQATTGGADYCLIWEVFARRGLGLNASSGNRNDSTDQVEDFTQPAPGPNCTALGTSPFANTLTYHIFPNPTQNEVHLQIPNYTSTISIRVMDINGRIVYQNTKALDNNDILIPMQSLESGLYILQATGENLMITEKIIKN